MDHGPEPNTKNDTNFGEPGSEWLYFVYGSQSRRQMADSGGLKILAPKFLTHLISRDGVPTPWIWAGLWLLQLIDRQNMTLFWRQGQKRSHCFHLVLFWILALWLCPFRTLSGTPGATLWETQARGELAWLTAPCWLLLLSHPAEMHICERRNL